MVITPNELMSRYLFGLDIRDANGSPLSEDVLGVHIAAAQDRVSRALDLVLEEQEFVETHDYYACDYQHWGFINLYKRPVIAVKEVTLHFGPSYCFSIPKEWIMVREDKATIQIFPTSGTIGTMLVTGQGNWIPLVFRRWDYAPQMWRVSYIAGFRSGECPPSIVDIVAKEACIGLAEGYMELVVGSGVGSQSVTVDGVSQSTTRLNDHPRIKQYREDVRLFYERLYAHYRGIDFEVG